MAKKYTNHAFEANATEADKLNENVRSEACIDSCGQSCFEVWLPVDAMESFDEWLTDDLGDLEQKFQSFVTRNSQKGSSRRS